VEQILDKSSHNNISSHSYDKANNKINTIYRDNYIHGNIPKSGKNMIITINTIGDRDDYIDTTRHNNYIPRINNNGDNKITYLNTAGTNEIYTQVDHIRDEINISNHSNTISTFGTIDNHSPLVSKNGTSNSYTQLDQGKQRYKKPTTHRRLTGTVGKGTGQGVINTGQNEDVSDVYSRIVELSALKTHGMLGVTNRHNDFYGTSSTTGLPMPLSNNQLGTNDKDMALDTSRRSNTYGRNNMD
jgi:hypothetical protein